MAQIWMLRASASASLALGVGLGLVACTNASPMGTAADMGSTNGVGGASGSTGGSGGKSTTGMTGSGGTNRGGNGGSMGSGGSAGSVSTGGSGGAGGSSGGGGGAGGSSGGAAGSGATGGSGTAGAAGADGKGGTSGAKDAGNGTAGTAPDASGGGTGGSGGTAGRDATSDVPADMRSEPAACRAAATFMVTNQSASAYVFDGTMSNPTLTLCRGTRYTFAVNSSGHPFYIKTAPVVGTGSTWDTGVTNNGVEVGNVVFVVPSNAPDTLYYQCSIHSVMTGTLHIVN